MNWNLIFQILIYYGIATVLIYVLSDYVMFPRFTAVPEYAKLPLIQLTTHQDKKIAAIYLKNPKAKYTILYSHGNAEDLWMIYPFLKYYHDQGYSVFSYDYQGYGQNLARPSENKTYQDILAAYDYLRHTLNIPAENIVLHGRSVGTGPTLFLAEREKVAAVILESAMLSAFRVLTVIPLFPVDKYPNNRRIQKITLPILFIHGTEDEVIPFWHGKKLYELARGPKKFYAVPNAHHNDLLEVAGPKYWETIRAFLHTLPNRETSENPE